MKKAASVKKENRESAWAKCGKEKKAQIGQEDSKGEGQPRTAKVGWFY